MSNSHHPTTANRSRPEPTTRVDAAHGSPLDEEQAAHAPPLDLLQAIAGNDSALAPQQLRGQALELAAILKEKQRLLEQRESELNARTALLENELRNVRLKHSHRRTSEWGEPPQAAPALPVSPLAPQPMTPAESVSTDNPDEEHALFTPSPSKLAEARSRWREAPNQEPTGGTTDPDGQRLGSDRTEPPNHGVQSAVDWGRKLIETDLSDEAERAAAASGHPTREIPDPHSSSETSPEARQSDLDRQYEHLEQQRQQLRQRESRIDQRKRALDQMQDEVLQLHREALELRFSTEQVWADLMEEFPAERLTQSLAEARARLADHYRLANDALSRRKDELHDLRAELSSQEQRLRQQRREIQMWADRRYDEVEARLAKLIVRERELDELEGEYQRQAIIWQQQRESYREEIERLTWQLREA